MDWHGGAEDISWGLATGQSQGNGLGVEWLWGSWPSHQLSALNNKSAGYRLFSSPTRCIEGS